MKNILGIIICSLLINSCATYQDFMSDSNYSLEKYFLEYTMNADSVLITKYPAHTFETYINYRKGLTEPDTIFNYQVDVLDKNGYTMNFYFSDMNEMDSCVIKFKSNQGLKAYLNQYLDLTCPYNWFQLDSTTYIQTNSWALKTSTIDPKSGKKQKQISSRVLEIISEDKLSLPMKLKVSIPLMNDSTWKKKTQANKKSYEK